MLAYPGGYSTGEECQENILHYEIDWDVFEKQVKKARMFLLCNPHNPLGIIYSRKELIRGGDSH